MDVYTEPVRTRYTANSAGAYLLVLISVVAVIAAPLAIGFSMGQFWITSNVLKGQPTISYTNRLIVRAETGDGDAMIYVSSPTVMDELEDAILGDGESGLFKNPRTGEAPIRPMYPAINLFRDDHDNDGITDAFNFQIAIPINYTNTSIARICILPEFYYTFDYPTPRLDIKMTSAPLLCVQNPIPTARFEAARLQGDIVFHASTLPESSDFVRYDRIYASSLFNKFTATQLAAIEPVAHAYALRNLTLRLEEKFSMFGDYNILQMSKTNIDHSGTLNSFNYEVTLKVHEHIIRYVPPWYENFKFGWIQYFCIAYVVYYFMNFIRSILVKQAVINTIAIWESRQRVVN